jgi:hypothetical protein
MTASRARQGQARPDQVANATSRSLFMNPRDRSWYYDKDANWQNMLFATGYEFETPIPMITKESVKPFPARASCHACDSIARWNRSSASNGD